MCSTFKTKWRRASPASSNRPYRPPRGPGRPTAPPVISRPMTFICAYAMVLSSGAIPEALQLMEQAIARDPGYGPALAWAANYYVRRCTDGTNDDPREDSRKGSDLARRALQATDDDPGTL